MSVISHWSVVDVTAWAEGCAGVAPFAHLFAENSLSGQDLLDLTHADLLSMGLSKLHDRKVVFRAIQQLLTGNEPLPVEGLSGATAVACGDCHSAAIADGKARRPRAPAWTTPLGQASPSNNRK